MVEIKVQASDSAAAMEEVEKRLGSDALIVSTTKVCLLYTSDAADE